MRVGFIIKQLQSDNGMSCIELAGLLSVTPQQLSRWRNANDLKLSIVKQVADVFGLGIDEFIAYRTTD